MFIGLEYLTSFKKQPISKVEHFLKSNFWPKSNIQSSAYTFGTLTQPTCFIFLLKFL